MANKIYDFLPGHLKNKELETIFDSTLERAFSKGETEKLRAYVGRREKGIYKNTDAYISYPIYSYVRKNYAFEPVYSNSVNGDNVFYDDFLNALYNKGALTNDHRRLLYTDYNTVNIPVDVDKFVNWSLYYWVHPGFDGSIVGSDELHYVTIEKTTGNWWSENNSWYHYEDIRELITNENSQYITQAKRPIIEFDNRLELADSSIGVTAFEEPKFNIYMNDEIIMESRLFCYVTGDYVYDSVLKLNPKVASGDYTAEFMFKIDMYTGSEYKLDGELTPIYIESEFKFRNFREEFNNFNSNSIELLHAADSSNIDIYVNGIKMIGGYNASENQITFDETVTSDYVYVDYSTLDPVEFEGDGAYQRLVPNLEYNIDNESQLGVELSYSTFYEHFVRIIETLPGIEGSPIGVNNYRLIGDNTDKIRNNAQGSVLITSNVDIDDVYFAVTRDDYNPFEALEFISTSYSSFKNKLIKVVSDILNEAGSASKTDSKILEEALFEISRTKNSVISMFSNVNMLNIGNRYSHYEEALFDVVPGSTEQFIPDLETPILDDRKVSIYVDGELKLLGYDYYISYSGNTLNFYDFTPTDTTEILLRHYLLSEDVYIPPSATKLDIAPAYKPEIITDNEYGEAVQFIVGHDGSKTPVWGDRTDSILLEFETRIYNNLENKYDRVIDYMNFLSYWDSDWVYTFGEKTYTLYPFFKKWMLKNNIDTMPNDTFDIDDWKTWNYKSINDVSPGHWRGLFEYVYGTDQIFTEPWKILKRSQKPVDFDSNFGTDYTTVTFWEDLIAASGLAVPVPVDEFGNLKTPNELFFNNSITSEYYDQLSLDWEFGDGSPEEFAWRRSSEFPFIAFIGMMLLKPVEVISNYSTQIDNAIRVFAKRDALNVDSIIREKANYQFKLGSKLAGFVNNVKIFSENSSLSNSRFTQIPEDNYKLTIHAGEPNRSEFYSAIIIEKVSLDQSHPAYDIDNVLLYKKGDVVLNPSDKKYYRRKVEDATQKEIDQSVNFDYSAWTLISQPKIRNFGYRVYGYDDFNPVFYTLDWDTTSGEKTFSTEGDDLNILPWMSSTFYRQDEYVIYNGQPYVCLNEHTSTTVFDNNAGNWKQLSYWPKTNVVSANGYKKLQLDQIKTYNYGDIITSVDEIAHLMVGYQGYLEAIGWRFTDVNDKDSSVIDFESLLLKFLDWSNEEHGVGEFITLTPMILTGEFNTPYGVASVKKETYKNFYRVIDGSGRLIPDSEIKFYSDGDVIKWESTTPIYGMKIDIRDVEHAVVFDREDSYGDVIYDPLSHNRNLRFIIDCNRTVDWDGTLRADGYIMYGDKMIPNFETLISDGRYYRDTFVDQNLEIINRLKARQIGFTPRTYLDNFRVERESQLEFYKGFIATKGTPSSINKIINNNSNYTDIHKSDVWAFYIDEFGKNNSNKIVSKMIETSAIVNDPHVVTFDDIENPLIYKEDNSHSALVKTTGYVDAKLVNYVVSGAGDLERLNTVSIYEGDTAWVQFDPDRDWDVRRLSEIAEINYIGETSDGQLYVVLTNEVDTTDAVYIKIISSFIDPTIDNYYYLVDDGSFVENGLTVYKYLVFEINFEPLIVEIDSDTSDSTYSPAPGALGVEAIGTNAEPVFDNGDTLVINGTSYVYDASGSGGENVYIQGTVANPYVQQGETIRLVVYNTLGEIENTNTTVVFDALNAVGSSAVTSSIGDKIIIDGTTLTVAPSSVTSVSVTSGVDKTTNVLAGQNIIIDGNVVAFDILSLTGTTLNYEITTTRPMQINGFTIQFIPDTGAYPDSSENVANQTSPVSSIVLVSDMTNHTPGDITVTTSTGTTTLTTSDYSWVPATNTIVFNTAQEDVDGFVDFDVELIGNTYVIPFTVDDMIDEINLVSGTTGVSASNLGGAMHLEGDSAELTIEGSIIADLGFTGGDTTLTIDKFTNIANDISLIPNITGSVTVDDRLRISSSNSSMTISGTALTELNISAGTYTSTTDPTATSISDQINSLGISGVSAVSIGGFIKVIKDGQTLSLIEDVSTPGSMSRLGFTSTSVIVNAVDQIVADINAQAFNDDVNIGDAYVSSGTVVITSPNKSISISNILGNPLTDIGITSGTYTSGATSTASYIKFKDQINEVATDILVSVTSDGRMVFTSDAASMSFSGTLQTILTRIGLYEEYTSIKSNPNFKIMRWKSVRYTPGFNGETFNEFYADLGLNDVSYIWADEYLDEKWHVIERTSTGFLRVIARQADVVDTTKAQRLIIRDGTNFYQYSLFDPLNGVIPGEISKKIKYITWTDPAKYASTSEIEKWMDEHIGEVWWDTTDVRYYRYHDYGDNLGNIIVPYVKKYWGKIVPGSEVVVKRWTKSTVLPSGVNSYNTYTYFDIVKNKNVTLYYYWTETRTIAGDSNDYSVSELKMILESDMLDKKFMPINDRTILLSNKTQTFNEKEIELTLEYTINENNDHTSIHKEWELFSETNGKVLSSKVYEKFKNSIIDMHFDQIETNIIEQFDLDLDPEYVIFSTDIASGGGVDNVTVSINNKFVDPERLVYSDTEIKIRKIGDIVSGDIVRFYRAVTNGQNLFIDVNLARDNFSSVITDLLSGEIIDVLVSDWREYISDELIFSLDNWYINDRYKVINKFEYLSKTRDFDMISLYNSGVKSFKIETDYDEYFFEFDGTLRLVNRSRSSLAMDTTNVEYSEYFEQYYRNAIGIQLYEFFNLIEHYFDNDFKKTIVREMTNYLFSETGEKTMELFKTSNIDLGFTHRPLQQYAIYQRDSYQDLIDYVNETKPYHTKIRDVKVTYPLDESMNAVVTEYEEKIINLQYGTTREYVIVVDTDLVSTPIVYNVGELFNPVASVEDLEIYIDGVLLDDVYYHYDNGDLYFNTNEYLYDTDDVFARLMVLEEGQNINIVKKLSRYDFDVIDGLGTEELVPEDYDAAYLLKIEDEYTSTPGGIDAGLIPTRPRESVFVKVENFTDETRTVSDGIVFYAYDQLGRGYKITTKDTVGTISSFDGSTLIVNQQSYFDEAKSNTKRMVVLEKSDGYEFMLYDDKSGTNLNVTNRKLFSGVGYQYTSGDTIYVVKSVTMI